MNQSGCKVSSALTQQTPVYDKDRLFRRKTKAGRPAKNKKKQNWVK